MITSTDSPWRFSVNDRQNEGGVLSFNNITSKLYEGVSIAGSNYSKSQNKNQFAASISGLDDIAFYCDPQKPICFVPSDNGGYTLNCVDPDTEGALPVNNTEEGDLTYFDLMGRKIPQPTAPASTSAPPPPKPKKTSSANPSISATSPLTQVVRKIYFILEAIIRFFKNDRLQWLCANITRVSIGILALYLISTITT